MISSIELIRPPVLCASAKNALSCSFSKGFSMVGTKDILALMEKWPLWKRLVELPSQVEALEERVASLEAKPKLPICEACGEGYLKLVRTEAPGGPFDILEGTGLHMKIYKCDKCGFETKKSSR